MAISAHVYARDTEPGEIGVALVFPFDPRMLNEYLNKNGKEKFDELVEAILDGEYEIGKEELTKAVTAYVTEQQGLIDATK